MKSPRSREIDNALLKFKRQEIDGAQLKTILQSLNPNWYQTGWFWGLFILILVLIFVIVIILTKSYVDRRKTKESPVNTEKGIDSEKSPVFVTPPGIPDKRILQE